MSVDVAFESAEEISRKLSRYEQLFKSKYTEADAGYRRCVANAEKVRQVPVIDPWPPRGVFSRRGRYNKHDDWDGGGGRRRGHRGRRRDNRYHHDPYPRYYDDRPPPPGPWGYGPRSPRDDYRDRSPHRPISPHPHHYHRHGSSSPLPYPPPPSHSHHLSPHSHHPHHRRSPRSRSVSPAPPPHTRTPPHRSPLRDRDSESASGQEAPPTVPHLLNLDLEERDDRIPSESDVQDILSFAHAPLSQVTAENLRQAKMEGRKTHRSKQDSSRTGKKMVGSGHGGGKIQDNVAPSGQGLLITHGKPELVSTLYLLGNQEAGEGEEGRGRGITQKKMKKARRSESDDERLGGGTHGFVMRGDGESRGSGEGLVMKLDKKFCHSNSDSSILSHSVPSTPSSDLTPTFSQGSSLSYPHRERDLRLVCSELPGPGTARPSTVSSLPPTPTSPLPPPSTAPLEVVREKRRKKKKKKKKKSSCDKEEEGEEWEEMVTVAPLKLKITLGKSPKSLDS